MTSIKDNKQVAALSSTICSLFSATLLNPLEVIKIRQQAENKGKFIKMVLQIFQKEGGLTFYNGYSYTLVTNGISVGAYLFIYDYLKTDLLKYKELLSHQNASTSDKFLSFSQKAVHAYNQSDKEPIEIKENQKKIFEQFQTSLAVPVICSSIARFITSTFFFPFECFKTFKQSHQGFNWINFSEIFRKQGFKAYSITLQRDILLAQVYWVCAENIREQLQKKQIKDTVKNILIGGVSGIISAIATLPFDVIKTQKQTSIIRGSQSSFNVAKEIYFLNGVKGFFLGFQPRVLKITFHGTILMTSYEYVYKSILKQVGSH